MSDPGNLGWLERSMRVSSFPVGRIYHYGAEAGVYLKGPSAPEIAQELMRLAEELKGRGRRGEPG